MSAPEEHVGLRFMTRFQCLGSACEDPCCLYWQIPVDEPHVRAISAALGDTPELARALRRLPVVDQRPDRAAEMALDERGRCQMLEDDNLCSLHRRYGEAVLGDQCATYPRTISRAAARLEISGATSLCLLADDAVYVVPVPVERFVRHAFTHELDDPASARLDEIRALLVELLRAPYPMASRQTFVAAFATHTAAYLSQGTPIDHAHLDDALRRFRDPRTLARLHGQLTAARVDPTFAVTIVLAVLDAEPWPRGRKFAKLVERIRSRYAPAVKKGTLDPERVAAMFDRRRGELPAHLVTRFEQQLRNAAINDVYQDWHTDCPSLLDLVSLHLVQQAVVRFLVVSHPDTSKACKLPSAEGLALFDATVVTCVSHFSRAAHHSHGLGARIMQKLADGGLQTTEHLASLAAL